MLNADTIRDAVDGLVYMSETDAPLEPVFVPKEELGDREISPGLAAELAGSPEGVVETVAPDAFFEPLMTEEEWFGEEERQAAEGFRRLYAMLRENLSDFGVFRVGEVDVSILALGKTSAGDAAGFRTRAVET